jgi:hypothetical protein
MKVMEIVFILTMIIHVVRLQILDILAVNVFVVGFVKDVILL